MQIKRSDLFTGMEVKTAHGKILTVNVGLLGDISTTPISHSKMVEIIPPTTPLCRLVWSTGVRFAVREIDGTVEEHLLDEKTDLLSWLMIVTNQKLHTPEESAILGKRLIETSRREGLIGRSSDPSCPTPSYLRDEEIFVTAKGLRYYFPDPHNSALMLLDTVVAVIRL